MSLQRADGLSEDADLPGWVGGVPTLSGDPLRKFQLPGGPAPTCPPGAAGVGGTYLSTFSVVTPLAAWGHLQSPGALLTPGFG